MSEQTYIRECSNQMKAASGALYGLEKYGPRASRGDEDDYYNETAYLINQRMKTAEESLYAMRRYNPVLPMPTVPGSCCAGTYWIG